MLPIREIYLPLVASLKTHKRLLLQAPPGAGKSTWLPLQLIRDGHFKRIVMLEPRRLAARNIAYYLAQQQNEALGQSIGLRIRHEQYTSHNTRLEIVTEGVLTRMLQDDPELSGIDCLIFDEFHEHSLHADIALAFALESQAILREDLRIIIMSATLDTENMAEKLHCPVLSCAGRSFPISEHYYPLSNENAWLEAMPALIKQALNEQSGSCLVFLPGKREILQTANALKELSAEFTVHTLYGELSKELQQAAITPAAANTRKIVLSTNIAETSLTIEGITTVVDSGKRRIAQYNLNNGVSTLKTINHSLSSATQRAGRAGRLAKGAVYRLGSREQFLRRSAHDTPEILHSNISSLLLEAKLWGTELAHLHLLNPPSDAQIAAAETLLNMLEAIDKEGKITETGQRLAKTGTDIRHALMLEKAHSLQTKLNLPLMHSAIYLLALLETGNTIHADIEQALRRQLHAPQAGFSKALKHWQSRYKLPQLTPPCWQYLSILLAIAYPDRIAKRRGQGFLLANGAGVNARDDIWPNADYLLITELGERIYSAIALDITLVEELLPHLIQTHISCEFNEKTGRFVQQEQTKLAAIILQQQTIQANVNEAEKAQAFTQLIEKQQFKLFNQWQEKDSYNACRQLQIRMQLAHQHFPEQFPAADEAYLISNLALWLAPYFANINSLKALKEIDLYAALSAYLDYAQQQLLNRLLPSKITVPSGSTLHIIYQTNGPAKLSVRMQEVFGMQHTPILAQGKIALLLDLLSPAQRSLQLTQDLMQFWQSSYKEIQKEMKGRYPKHFWPDDPANAQASNKTKKAMAQLNK